ncbi:Trm112 family protein [Tateyamaria sp. SN6-1]|uniref:Trm112 family protein n=1 Tax=Tateyamaria sp. SN6-1 TaxID=3092148 RepID=UPI0039F63346
MTDTVVDRRMLEALICPETHGTLRYDAERNELVSEGAGQAYPIRNGIPVMLVDEARSLDDDAKAPDLSSGAADPR